MNLLPEKNKGVIVLKKFIAIFLPVFILFLTSCSGLNTVELPEPSELFAEIESKVQLLEMVSVPGDYLKSNTGIDAESYSSMVYYLPFGGMSPEEIIIIRAVDEIAADDIQKKLEVLLADKEMAAQNYLTENMPVIKEGFVRRDGLTISLIISEQSAQIAEIYNYYD